MSIALVVIGVAMFFTAPALEVKGRHASTITVSWSIVMVPVAHKVCSTAVVITGALLF